MKNGFQNVNGKTNAPISREDAHSIMRENFFGPEQWLSSYGIWFSKQQLKTIDLFPWNESVLNAPCPFIKGKMVKETHFAFLGIDRFNNKPLDILKWHELNPVAGNGKPMISLSDQGQDFARIRTCWFKWHLMPIESIPYSSGKTYQEQAAMIPEKYRISFAVEEIAKNILYYKRTGVWLNYKNWVRCQDSMGNGSRPCVGEFIRVRSCPESKQHPLLGLSVYRKLPSSN